MTKKKKTLRAAVLASIFAMSICGWSNTVWADNTNKLYTTDGYYANPTLVSESGIGAGVGSPSSSAYGPDYNYYLQYNEYIDHNESRWDRIVGIKLTVAQDEEDGAFDITLANGQQIKINTMQLHHVVYDSQGTAISADGPDIDKVFLYGADEATDARSSHYCGESAQSITVGQIQKMNEVNYNNFKSMSEGMESIASDTKVIRDAYVKDITIDGDNIKFTEVIGGVEQDEQTYTDKHITDFTQSIIGYGQENAGTITSTIKTNFDDDINRTVNISSYVSDAIRNEAKNADVTYNGSTTNIQDAITKIDAEVSKGWKATINGDTYINTVTMGDTQNFNQGKNIVLSKDEDSIKVSTSDVVEFTQVTVGDGESKITINNDGIDMSNKEIKKVTNLTANTIVADTSITTPTLILQDGNSTTNLKWNSTTNRIEYGPEGSQQHIATLDDGMKYGADNTNGDKNLIDVDLNGQLNILGGKNITTESDGESTITVKLDDEVKGLTLVESTTVKATTVNTTDINVSNQIEVGDKVTITQNGMNINNKVVVEGNKVDVGGNKIENVADGEVSKDSKDAVNGGQLYQEQQERIAGDNMLSNRLDKLGNRVDKVGAGAAALAALHPLDFDPDDKLSFSAGVGNYGGETATALGMFYRPTEKVMLSAAGTMGNGENMVNKGVTFALDKTNNVSNSRVAMAREIQDLREQVAALTALVTQLAGRSNPALQDVVMFPDVPENHWAYDYIEGLQKRGIVEGYPDGNFAGDRSMTRYEYAAMLYRALEKGFPVDSRLLDEFDAELGRIRVDRIKGLDDDANKVERVRVNQYEDRDDYGSKLITVNAVKQ